MCRDSKAFPPRNLASSSSYALLKIALVLFTVRVGLMGSVPAGFAPLSHLSALEQSPPKLFLTRPPSPVLSSRPPSPRSSPGFPHAWDYFHAQWEADGGNEISITPSPPSLSNESLRYLLGDPHSRLDRELEVPETLKARVLFWVEIYTVFNSRMKVLHDRDNPEILYGYIDFNPLMQAERPSRTLERKMKRIEREIKAELKRRLENAFSPRKARHSPSQADAMDTIRWRAFLATHQITSEKQVREHEKKLRSQSGQADMFEKALYRSQTLLPKMEEVFREHGLPAGLAHIPFVESSFDGRAYSRAGARGIWQFTNRAAREFIGRKNRREWSDPLLQTECAAHMLMHYRSVFPDWGTTVTSYNSGVGRVSKLLQRYGETRAEDLTHHGRGLGFAGQNYYAEFLAANFIASYRTELFSPDLFQEKNDGRSIAGALDEQSDSACLVLPFR